MKLKQTILAISVIAAFSSQEISAAPILERVNQSTPVSQIERTNAWVEIDKAAFEGNIKALQNRLAGQSQICAVMKANAYGHGIGLLVPSVIAMGVPCIAVASNEEARVVREKGFKGRLMRVRTAGLTEVKDALRYNIEELVGNYEFARQAANIAAAHGKTLRVHLALNSSGMSRNGIEMSTEQGRKDALDLVRLPHLKVAGIMTHFAVEDREDVLKGLAAFKEQSQWVIDNAKLDRKKIVLHSANSFATLEVPEARLDMVRPGGALYGDTIPAYSEFKRVMSFKTKVASLNHYPAGNTVGYDRTFTLKRDSVLANLPMGYSDGYRRVFTNKGYVLIQGQRAPVVGKVSMNTTMVDVTDLKGVNVGDEVVLFGKQGGAEVTQEEVENINGALLADLYTVWGNSNPKIFKSR